jgi:hypothetical protein
MNDTATTSRGTDAARQRLALAQTALLSSLVAGTPVPQGFDPARVRVQSRALAAKRADVTVKVAPELPQILGERYRPAFLAYALANPLPGGARLDAMAFAQGLLVGGELTEPQRDDLVRWVRERSGPGPRGTGRLRRLARAARARLASRGEG